MKPKFLAPGTVIAERYEVRGLISSGNFGMVYRVYDRTAGEDVALKRLHASAQAVPEQLARFEREAKLGSRLDHPNIVPHLASGVLETVHGGGPYLILALVRGLPLGDLIDTRRRLRVEESVHILAHVLDALDAVHREGAIHRDLKPDNILLASPAHARGDFDMAGSIAARVGVPEPDDALWSDLTRCDVTLLDFGLGKFLPVDNRQVTKITATGMSAGTLHYMSPEQVRARRDVDYAADIYGAAMLLFRMLDGAPPYSLCTMVEVAHHHLTSPPPDLPDGLNEQPIGGVYRRSAAKKPRDRFESAAQMAWALRASNDPELAAKPPPFFEPPPPLRPMGFWSRLFGR